MSAELTPAQRRVRDELLAWERPRPPAEPGLADRLRERLTELTADAVAEAPPDASVFLSKGRLDALSCDGRYLDLLATPFTWGPQTVRGQLAHKGIEIDAAGRRRRDPIDVVAAAWEHLAASPGAGDYLVGLSGGEADALRGEARKAVAGFREQFPDLPDRAVHPEEGLRVRLHGGRLVLQGRCDLRLGRPDPDERRMLLLDLKTGAHQPLHHRADMRLYALLATLKHGVAPFRVATYYLDEADWDAEDVDADVLEAALRDVAAKAVRAVRLEHRPPAEDALELVPGSHCSWCGRRPTCPAVAAEEATA